MHRHINSAGRLLLITVHGCDRNLYPCTIMVISSVQFIGVGTLTYAAQVKSGYCDGAVNIRKVVVVVETGTRLGKLLYFAKQ